MSFFNLIIVGLLSGAILASTGVIGPFLIPALVLLGFPPSVVRGTCLVSELLMTLISVIIYKKAKKIDKRVVLAFLPGAVTVALGANMSLKFPEPPMKFAIGIFEIVIGIAMIITTIRRSKARYSKTVINATTFVMLVFVAILAGFVKGFFGAGWGPLGIGLFILLGINPKIVVGSNLAIRLLLDCVGGFTYLSKNLVDYNAVKILTLAGCATVPLAAKLTAGASEKTLKIFLGGAIIFLGTWVIAGL